MTINAESTIGEILGFATQEIISRREQEAIEYNAKIIGETMRSYFFGTEKGYGCYSNFEYAIDDKEVIEKDENENSVHNITCSKTGVKCRWYWDGDGYLEFIFPDGTIVSNNDCKKDYKWTLDGN